MRRGLVLGGTGAVGSAVLRELARRGVAATFTYRRSADKAAVLAAEYGHRAVQIDLADAVATRACLDALEPTEVVIHAAAVSAATPIAEVTHESWRDTMAINVGSAFVACQWVAARGTPCDLVFVTGLDRTQSLPLPPHFAATQGAIDALAMAAANELGPRGIRINVVALGVLTTGLSAGLAATRRKDYETFSALRRAGTPDEAARVIAWLALDNTFIQGKVISVNGGI
jgi:NAD(P)-dependent dehydrogenase (short-subunit alcohol dehydrogenase family)